MRCRLSNISEMLTVEIIGQKDCLAYKTAEKTIRECGCKIVHGEVIPDVAVAPLLTRKIGDGEIDHPCYGTLIFIRHRCLMDEARPRLSGHTNDMNQ